MSWVGELFYQIKRLVMVWVTVAPWERALRVRAGKHVKLLEPGIHIRIPYIDRVFKQSVRTRVSNVPGQTLTTKDNATLTISAILMYEISDIEKLYQKLHHAEDTITGMAASAIAEYVANHTKEECTPAIVENEANSSFATREYGIAGTKISFTSFAYVKTYRFITGDNNAYSYGDVLNTDRNEKV